MAKTRSDYFLFGSICIKKSNQTGFFLKTETEQEPVRTDRFWFGWVILEKNRFNPVGSVFFRFGSVLSVSGI
jgi:hypothetical protein